MVKNERKTTTQAAAVQRTASFYDRMSTWTTGNRSDQENGTITSSLSGDEVAGKFGKGQSREIPRASFRTPQIQFSLIFLVHQLLSVTISRAFVRCARLLKSAAYAYVRLHES